MTSLQGNFPLTALLKGRCAAADAEEGGGRGTAFKFGEWSCALWDVLQGDEHAGTW